MNNTPVKVILWCFLSAMSTYAVPADAKTAIAEASASNRVLLLTFYEKEDASFTGMTATIAAFKKSSPTPCAVFNAKFSEPANAETAARYGVSAASLPLLLVIAPNGAVLGGYPNAVTADQLQRGMSTSELVTRILKPLQEQKVVLAVLQNGSTQFNAEAMQGVNDFTKEYEKFVAIVKADPADPKTDDFIRQCQILPPLTQSTVVVLLPPGKIGKIMTGKVSKADILASLKSCTPGSGSGCCSDRRFKQNITPVTAAIDKVSKLQAVTFTWNRAGFPGRFFPEGTEIGFIAQDVESVIPEVVRTDAEGYKSVCYDKFTAILAESLKELKTKLDRQDSNITAQNERIRKLEASRK
jgi:hypothetical protein